MTVATRYRIEGPIGVGPDGVVHRALAERLGARPVAVRSVPVPAGARRAELRHRAELVARVPHHGIARVVDLIDVDDHTVQVATELGVDGNLADRLLLATLSGADVVAIATTIADALSAAAGLGLHHGHLSATNVVLGDRGPTVTDLALLPPAGTSSADDRRALGGLLVAMGAVVPIEAHRTAVVGLGRALEADPGTDWSVVRRRLAALRVRLTAPPAPGLTPIASPAATARPPLTPATIGAVVAGAASLGLLIGAATTAIPF